MERLKNAVSASAPGAEPGADPRRSDARYGHIKEATEIEITDYSASNVDFNQYDVSIVTAVLSASNLRATRMKASSN